MHEERLSQLFIWSFSKIMPHTAQGVFLQSDPTASCRGLWEETSSLLPHHHMW